MITGIVLGRRAVVHLTVRSASGREREIEFVLDTGFVGFLTMPPAAVVALGLPFAHQAPAQLADGSRIVLEAYKASVLWDGVEQEVEVLATGGDALLGTSLLSNHEVNIQFADGGAVTIELL